MRTSKQIMPLRAGTRHEFVDPSGQVDAFDIAKALGGGGPPLDPEKILPACETCGGTGFVLDLVSCGRPPSECCMGCEVACSACSGEEG